MNKTIAGVLLAAVSIILIGGVVYSGTKDDKSVSSNTSSAAGADHFTETHKDDGHHDNQEEVVAPNTVLIKDFDFAPETTKVKIGTKVTWTNKDSAKHDITPDTESPDFIASELLGQGESYSFTFTKAGTYAYHCSPHPYMKAMIEVVE